MSLDKLKTNSIPALDGIRALSIGLVFSGHAGLRAYVPGGFGCTVFFFLSGFLITTLLRKEWDRTGEISIRQFYLRRALRILIPLYVTMAFLIGLSTVGLLNVDPELDLQLVPVLYQALHLTNVHIINFGVLHLIEGSSPLWSLAVEMHFYFIYPFAFILMGRLSARSRALAIGLTCLLILAWRCVLVFGFDSVEGRTYYMSDTRMDSLLFGCILGVYHNPVLDPIRLKNLRTKLLLLTASGAILLLCFVWRDQGFRESLRYSLQGLALMPIFYLAIVDHEWPLFSWLNQRTLRFVGVISYTFYLVHKSLLKAVANGWPEGGPIAVAMIALALSLGFSVAMHYFIEQPVARARSNRAPLKTLKAT